MNKPQKGPTGRLKRTRIVSISLPIPLAEELHTESLRRRCSVSALVTRILAAQLADGRDDSKGELVAHLAAQLADGRDDSKGELATASRGGEAPSGSRAGGRQEE